MLSLIKCLPNTSDKYLNKHNMSLALLAGAIEYTHCFSAQMYDTPNNMILNLIARLQ